MQSDIGLKYGMILFWLKLCQQDKQSFVFAELVTESRDKKKTKRS